MATRVKQTVAKQTPDEKKAKQIQKILRLDIIHQPNTVNKWIKAKLKLPEMFTVTDDGDLLAPPVEAGDIDRIIYLPPEEPTTMDEVKEYFATRVIQLQEPEEAYAAAKRELRTVIEAYKLGQRSVHDVVDANNNVHTAECILNTKAKGARNIEYYDKVVERELTLNRYDVRKFPKDIPVMEYSIFPWQAFWKKTSVGDVQEVPPTAQVPPSVATAAPRDPEAARKGAIIGNYKASARGAV